jgi:hypothetical protein
MVMNDVYNSSFEPLRANGIFIKYGMQYMGHYSVRRLGGLCRDLIGTIRKSMRYHTAAAIVKMQIGPATWHAIAVVAHKPSGTVYVCDPNGPRPGSTMPLRLVALLQPKCPRGWRLASGHPCDCDMLQEFVVDALSHHGLNPAWGGVCLWLSVFCVAWLPMARLPTEHDVVQCIHGMVLACQHRSQ